MRKQRLAIKFLRIELFDSPIEFFLALIKILVIKKPLKTKKKSTAKLPVGKNRVRINVKKADDLIVLKPQWLCMTIKTASALKVSKPLTYFIRQNNNKKISG